MKHKVSELEGALLDAAVAKAEGHTEIEMIPAGAKLPARCEVVLPGEDGETYWTEYSPSTEWTRGGPIIERERISINAGSADEWFALMPEDDPLGRGCLGRAPLIAAMRAYVASKFGEEIDLP